MHWFIDPIQKQYADFTGRATRKEYWMFHLVYVLLFLVVSVIGRVLVGEVSPTEEPSVLIVIASALILIGFFGTIVPALAITVRRLHDIGKSGWWILLSFIPYIGGIVLLVFYCLPSEKGSNKYGANKYGVEASVLPNAQVQPVAVPTTPTIE